MKCGFENREEFLEIELRIDFGLDDVRQIQINLQVTLIMNRLIFVILPPVSKVLLYLFF